MLNVSHFYLYLVQNIITMTSEQIERLIKSVQNAKVGGVTTLIKVSGTDIGVSGAAYGSGDVLGTTAPIQLKNFVRGDSGTAAIQSLIVQDLSNQSGALDVVFFDSNPTATTFTDNSALDIADADITKIISVVSITSANYKTFNDNCVAVLSGLSIPIQSLSGNSLWIAVVSRDTKTYVANELSLVLGIYND